MRKTSGFSLVLAAALAIAAAPAWAGETTGTLMVSVNVVASCRLTVDTAALSFGSVDQNAGSAKSSAGLGVRCSSKQPYSIGFDYGQHSRGGLRRMTNGNREVAYQLYADAAGRRPLGPRGSGSELHGIGNGDEQSLPVYGRLDLDRDTPSGMYTDVVRMTVIW